MGDIMNQDLVKAKDSFNELGWAIIKNEKIFELVHSVKKIFIDDFKSRFGKKTSLNRELIKRFGDHPSVSSIYTDPKFVAAVREVSNISLPVFCGSLVTHYTANDLTGGGYGLPFHQDYPSMGSSLNSIICWCNLTDANSKSHGVEVLSSMHKEGLLQGLQTERGYIIDNEKYSKNFVEIPSVDAGNVLIMSAFLPHKTYVNPAHDGWKLSLSRRFDDLDEKSWENRGYKNAYDVSVDRGLYQTAISGSK
jgi:hypothetical protein